MRGDTTSGLFVHLLAADKVPQCNFVLLISGCCDDTESNTFPIEASALRRRWTGGTRNTHLLGCINAPALRGLVVKCARWHQIAYKHDRDERHSPTLDA